MIYDKTRSLTALHVFGRSSACVRALIRTIACLTLVWNSSGEAPLVDIDVIVPQLRARYYANVLLSNRGCIFLPLLGRCVH